MKAIQLDAGVKAVLKGCNDAGAQKGFGAAKKNGNDYGQSRQQQNQAGRNPLQPPVPAPERCANLRHERLRLHLIVAGAACANFPISRCRA